MKITPLGSFGWMPAQNNQTCCYCLELNGLDNRNGGDRDNVLVIFDAGTGLSRFSEDWAKSVLPNYNSILILLSHYHLDHVSGLIYLSRFFLGKKIHIAGPGKNVYGETNSAEEILNRLICPPFFSRRFRDFPMKVTVSDLEVGSNMIDGIRVDTILQQHSNPSLGLKVMRGGENGNEHSICYLTDTACNPDAVGFVRNCKWLLHESWFDRVEYNAIIEQGKTDTSVLKRFHEHSGVDGVAALAANASVESLMLIHLNPSYDVERLKRMEADARETFKNSFLAAELRTF